MRGNRGFQVHYCYLHFSVVKFTLFSPCCEKALLFFWILPVFFQFLHHPPCGMNMIAVWEEPVDKERKTEKRDGYAFSIFCRKKERRNNGFTWMADQISEKKKEGIEKNGLFSWVFGPITTQSPEGNEAKEIRPEKQIFHHFCGVKWHVFSDRFTEWGNITC